MEVQSCALRGAISRLGCYGGIYQQCTYHFGDYDFSDGAFVYFDRNVADIAFCGASNANRLAIKPNTLGGKLDFRSVNARAVQST
jgi:hypothetical protein